MDLKNSIVSVVPKSELKRSMSKFIRYNQLKRQQTPNVLPRSSLHDIREVEDPSRNQMSPEAVEHLLSFPRSSIGAKERDERKTDHRIGARQLLNSHVKLVRTARQLRQYITTSTQKLDDFEFLQTLFEQIIEQDRLFGDILKLVKCKYEATIEKYKIENANLLGVVKSYSVSHLSEKSEHFKQLESLSQENFKLASDLKSLQELSNQTPSESYTKSKWQCYRKRIQKSYTSYRPGNLPPEESVHSRMSEGAPSSPFSSIQCTPPSSLL